MSEHDEYGLEKPHTTWMEDANELMRPKEGAGPGEQLLRAFGAAPVLIGAHILDGIPIVNGGALPGEAGHIKHSYDVAEYQRRRAEIEAQREPAPGADYGPEGECDSETGDEVPYYLRREVEPTYQWMAD